MRKAICTQRNMKSERIVKLRKLLETQMNVKEHYRC